VVVVVLDVLVVVGGVTGATGAVVLLPLWNPHFLPFILGIDFLGPLPLPLPGQGFFAFFWPCEFPPLGFPPLSA
jgi:hypothetical protein